MASLHKLNTYINKLKVTFQTYTVVTVKVVELKENFVHVHRKKNVNVV